MLNKKAMKSEPPKLFEGAAWYYARYRPSYAPEVVETLINRFHLNEKTRVLDLGSGTGQLAIPLSARKIPVHAVDPDLEMLSEGLRAEERAGTKGIAWYRGDDSSIRTLYLPTPHLCTMGASFHWMDRDQILQVLDSMIDPTGGIAVLSGGSSVWSGAGSGWPAIAKAVVIDFLGPDRRAGGGFYNHPQDRHEVVLARSPFRKIDLVSIKNADEKTVQDIVGLQLSTSYASPAQLGDRLDEFRQVLREKLLNLEASGVFHGETTTEIIIATRSPL